MNKNEIFRKSLNYIQFKIKDILNDVTKNDIDKVITLFFEANRIFVYGAGRSGLVAKAFAIRLVHLGFQTFVIGETIGAPVKKDDLVFVISGSGETIPTVMTAEITRNIGAKLIVTTGERNSAWILLDSIIAELMICKGETEESMQSRHATLE
jgi:6-phospho 3-hexuloisomerase